MEIWVVEVMYHDCRAVYGPFDTETEANNWQHPPSRKVWRARTVSKLIPPNGPLPEFLVPLPEFGHQSETDHGGQK